MSRRYRGDDRPPPVVADAVARRVREGITPRLPTEDSVWVGEELRRRFGLPYWQFTLTATDANRFAMRIARENTQRKKILVFNYCYHGTVDESFATTVDSSARATSARVAATLAHQSIPPKPRVVEFNDLAALETALKHNRLRPRRARHDQRRHHPAR
jgi:glutamate-1-semialdehyde 2,1-aminomutase